MAGDELLRALGGASASAAVERATSKGTTGAASSPSDFQAMLERAQAGTFQSGLPVSVANGSGVELTDSQLSRLGTVIDRLHANGASHAMVEIDGRFVIVDVITRQVRSEFRPGDGESIQGIDAVVSAPPAPPERVGPPAAGILMPSLATALGGQRESAA